MSKSKEIIELIKSFKSTHDMVQDENDILKMTDEEISDWNHHNIILEQDIRDTAKEYNINYKIYKFFNRG